MFFYVGAEACTAGFFINYLKDQSIAGFSTDKAGDYLSYYYIVATIVGFLSIYLFRFFSAGKLVAVFGTGMVLLLLLCSLSHSSLNPYYMVGLGVFISILFPTVFSLGIERLGDFTEKGSALMNIAIVGGAVFPPIQGLVADAGRPPVIIPCTMYLFCVDCCVWIVLWPYGCRRNELLSPFALFHTETQREVYSLRLCVFFAYLCVKQNRANNSIHKQSHPQKTTPFYFVSMAIS